MLVASSDPKSALEQPLPSLRSPSQSLLGCSLTMTGFLASTTSSVMSYQAVILLMHYCHCEDHTVMLLPIWGKWGWGPDPPYPLHAWAPPHPLQHGGVMISHTVMLRQHRVRLRVLSKACELQTVLRLRRCHFSCILACFDPQPITAQHDWVVTRHTMMLKQYSIHRLRVLSKACKLEPMSVHRLNTC